MRSSIDPAVFGVLNRLNSQDKKCLSGLFRVYRDLDKKTAAFQKASGLGCRKGCGQCCDNPDVETSILEMMPVAIDLWQKNTAGAWLDKVESLNGRGRCVFYEPHPFSAGQGRCTIYPLRPLICRLFGFSARLSKTGKPVLVTCRVIKTDQSGQYTDALKQIEGGAKIPVMPHFSSQVAGLNLMDGARQLPINTALRLALERVGLKIRLGALYAKSKLQSRRRGRPAVPKLSGSAGRDTPEEF